MAYSGKKVPYPLAEITRVTNPPIRVQDCKACTVRHENVEQQDFTINLAVSASINKS